MANIYLPASGLAEDILVNYKEEAKGCSPCYIQPRGGIRGPYQPGPGDSEGRRHYNGAEFPFLHGGGNKPSRPGTAGS